MLEFTVWLDRADEAFEFCNAMSKLDCNIDIESVDGAHVVDAKSVLGVLSLGLSHILKIKVHSDDPDTGLMVSKALDSFKTVSRGDVSINESPKIAVNNLGELEALIGRDAVARLFEEYSGRAKELGPDGLPLWLHANPELDVAKGLEMCGSPEIYLETLRSFCRHAGDVLPDMQAFVSSCDLESYAVKVHSLKSSAALVGAVKLSDMARVSEESAIRGDAKTVRKDSSKIMALYSDIAQFLTPLEDKAKPSMTGVTIDASDLPELYRNLMGYVEDFNDEAVGSMLNALTRYELPSGERARFESLVKAHEEADWEALHRLLSEN